MADNKAIILAMMPNPEPYNIRACLNCYCPIMNADTHRPKTTNFLEVK